MTRTVIFLLSFTVSFFSISQVTDGDGNIYDTVAIGTQVWLSSSLKTTRFSNGDLIPTTTPPTLNVSGETNPVYQWAYNGNDSLADIYGRLYTWNVVADERNVCPTGWHVPSKPEFNILLNYLGGTAVAGGKLKETGYEHWFYPNAGATNETGFNAVGNGNRNLSGYFNDMNLVSDMWSTTEGSMGAWDCDLHSGTPSTTSNDDPKGFAFAIRCLKNYPASISDSGNLIEISVYPVPAENYLHIDIKDTSDFRFEVFTTNGTKVLSGVLQGGINEIDIQNLETGVYFLWLTDSNNSIPLKFVKTN